MKNNLRLSVAKDATFYKITSGGTLKIPDIIKRGYARRANHRRGLKNS